MFDIDAPLDVALRRQFFDRQFSEKSRASSTPPYGRVIYRMNEVLIGDPISDNPDRFLQSLPVFGSLVESNQAYLRAQFQGESPPNQYLGVQSDSVHCGHWTALVHRALSRSEDLKALPSLKDGKIYLKNPAYAVY